MALETKHINLLRSCSRWLRVRASSIAFAKLHCSSLMNDYATDLSALADILQSMEPRETKISLDQLFEGKQDPYVWEADGDANFFTITKGKDWVASIHLNGELLLEAQQVIMIEMVRAMNGQPAQP